MNVKHQLRYVSNIALSALFILIATGTSAQADTVRQEMKCHVELLGGSETIYYSALLTNETVLQASKKLESSTILTTLSPKKIAVYKVKECVLKDASFARAQARSVEKLMEL